MFSTLKDIIISIRPHHWVKNLLVVAPPFFGGIVFLNYLNFVNTFLAFISFSLIASVGYLINDLLDANKDKLHPKKKNRPVASGRINKNTVIFLAVLLFIISVSISFRINFYFLLATIVYLAVTLLYSIALKKIVIVDSLCIATGFLLRIISGGLALNIDVSNWLYITTLLLSLLLAFGKRKVELELVEKGFKFREVLEHYDKKFLEVATVVLAVGSIITFSIYSFNKGWEIFFTTTPFVCFGTLRYLHLIRNRSEGDPTEVLLKDKWLSICVLSWVVLFGLIIYL